MKQRNAAIVCLVLALAVWAGFNLHRIRLEADAQESPKGSKSDAAADDARRPREAMGSTGDRPYPVFFIDDVLAKLSTGAEELIEKKLAKNSDQLRRDLGRTHFSTTLPRASTKELAPQELYRQASESVFLVAGLTKPDEKEGDWQTSFSTAFAVHEDGVLSTSAHVFDHHDQDNAVVVLDVKGKVHPIVEILAVDLKADTCLFRIGTKGLKALPLGKDAPPGTQIRVMGHPGDSFFFFSTGVIANYERDHDGLVWLNVTADFGQGSSGGPVMDLSGNVVGQVSRTYTLYAGGEASHRQRRRRMVRQADAAEPANEPMEEAPAEAPESKKNQADTQMIFKACTPVSAIRALVK
jgi:serine protease Do